MDHILTLEHIKRLRDLLLTKSDADLARMHKCLSSQMRGISHKIRGSDAKIAAQMGSDAFPGSSIELQSIGDTNTSTILPSQPGFS